MNMAAAIDVSPDDPASDEAGYGAMLRELAEIGMRVARRLDAVTEAVANGEPDALEKAAVLLGGRDVGAVLGRVSRGVRLTVMLAQRQAEADRRRAKDRAERQAAEDARAEAQREAALKREVETALAAGRKSDVRRIAVAAIETMARERGEAFDRETTLAELETLLDGEFADVGDYYLTAGVEMICEALGVTPDRSLWKNDMPGPNAFERASLGRGEDEDFDDWSP
jgi:hypothetical protein